MRIRWKWVAVILATEVFVGVLGAKSVYRCHTTFGSECWPWFGVFAINLPASVLTALSLGATNTYLSFYPQWLLSFVLYVGVGTAWWSSLVHCGLWVVAKVKGMRSQSNA